TDGDGCSSTCQAELRREITLTKVDDFDPALPGSLLTYTLSYTNTGEGNLSAVVLSDLVDPSTTFFSATPPPDDGTTDTWTVGELAPGQGGSVEITVVVGDDLADGDTLLNAAGITAAEGASAQDTEATQVSVTGDTALLRVEVLAHLASSRSPGGFVYTVAYRNEGVDTAVAAHLELNLPPSMSFGGGSKAPSSLTDGGASWVLGDLAPGAHGSFVVAVNLASGVSSGSSLSACAELNASPADGEVSSPGLRAGACASTTVVGECDLWFSKTHLPTPALDVSAPAAAASQQVAAAPASSAPGQVAAASRQATQQTPRTARAFVRPHTVTVAGNRHVRAGMGASYSVRYRDVSFLNSLEVVIPDGLTTTLISPQPASINGNVARWNNLPAPSGSIALRGIVGEDVIPGTGLVVDATLTNDSDVAAAGSFTTLVLDDTTVLPEDAEPLLSVTGIRNLRAGAGTSFSIRYSRVTDANSLVVDVPSGLVITSTSPAADSATESSLSWSDVHAPSGSVIVRGTVAEDTAPGTALTLTATITNDAAITGTAGFTTMVQDAGPVVSDPAVTLEGAEMTYELRWLAPCTDTPSVAMTDSLPAELDFVTAATTRGTLTRAGADVRIAYPVAEAGAAQLARIFSRLAADPAPGSFIVNHASLSRAGAHIADADPIEIPDRSVHGAPPSLDLIGRLFARDGRPVAMAIRLGDLQPGSRLLVSLPAEIVPTSVTPPPQQVHGHVLVWTSLPEAVATILVRGNIGLGMADARAAYLTTTAAVQNPDGRTASEEFHTLVTIKAPKPPVVRAARFSLSGQRWIMDGGTATLVGRYQHLLQGGAMEMTLPPELVIEAVYPDSGVVDGNTVRWNSLPGQSGKTTVFVRLAPGASSDSGYVTFEGTLEPSGAEPLARSRMVLLRGPAF
ncbi:MAG TPA: hypothetical protein VEL28_04315, partial [Candidatus Binatia bacterium]|nr:hypothetical protein [Candidatus Binatia bacterium]